MSDQPTTAVGVYEDRRHAHIAVEKLTAAGFSLDDVGFIMPKDNPVVEPPLMPKASQAPEGAATGAVAGGAVGALAGAALATAFIPGAGPVIAGGLLLGVIEGAVTGLAAGGLFGALVGLRVPEHEAQRLEKHFHSGRTIVTVRAGDRYDVAEAILREAAEVPE